MPGNPKFVVPVGEARPANGNVPSASQIYRSTPYKDGNPTLEVTTLYELFERAVEKYPNNDCLGVRPKDKDGKAGDYVFETYKEVAEQVTHLASGEFCFISNIFVIPAFSSSPS